MSCPVRSPTTISTSLEAGTGLKKCMPQKRSGRCSSAASPSIDRDEVLEASHASSRRLASTFCREETLRSQISGTASTTSSHCAKSA